MEEEFDINKEGAWLAEVLTNALEGNVVGTRPEAEQANSEELETVTA